MFNKNLEALKKNNPGLVKKLESITIDNAKANIQILEAESKDIIIAYNEIPLDGVYDPVREAKTLWNRTMKTELSKYDYQVVFGLGLGYLFKRAFVNAPSKILIYEPFIDVIRFVFEYIDLSNELQEERVFLSDDINECIDFINKKYVLNDKVEFLLNENYAKLASGELNQLTQKLIATLESKNIDGATILKQSKSWVINSLKNLHLYDKCRPINYLENNFQGKTALIVAAGPSLQTDIDEIKKNRDKFAVFSINRAVKTLLDNDITPDFVVYADQSVQKNTVEGLEEKLAKTHFIVQSKSQHWPLGLAKKSNLLYFSNTDEIAKLFSTATQGDIKTYESAGTTSIIAYLAAELLGFSQFVFSGLDLAFTGNQKYSQGADARNVEYQNTLYIKDKDGNDILTRPDYALFVRQFAEILNNRPRKVYNTSSGAYIKGMEYKSFSEAVKELEYFDKNIDDEIFQMFSVTQQKWDGDIKKIKMAVDAELQDIESIKTNAQDLLLLANSIKNAEESSAEIEDYTKESSNLLVSVMKNILLSTMVQGEMLDYTRKATTSSFEDKLDADLKLYELIVNSVESVKQAYN